jgi:peptidoglycan/LPS O-acetylase OafA/YrhL
VKLFRHLSRITTPGRRFIPQIDGLRFVAIMAVIALHIRQIVSFHFGVSQESTAASGDIVNEAFDAGWIGVNLFFAISGFVLVLPFAKQYLHHAPPVSLRAYFLRRITRLEPPYLIHLGFLVLLCALVYRHVPAHTHLYHNEHWAAYALPHILASLFYTNGFIFGTHPYPNNVLWSLEVEVQFYILAPVLAKLFKIQKIGARRAIIAILILAISSANYFAPPLYVITFSLAGNVQYFLAGFLLCDFFLEEWQDKPVPRFKWDFLFLSACAALIMIHRHPFSTILLPWLILICCSAAFKGRVCGKILSGLWITTIGGMCYTIYMYHWLMISGLIRLTAGLQTHIFWLDMIVQLVVMSAAITVMCALLFVLFERPFMQRDWPAKFWKTIRRVRQNFRP